MPTIRKRGDRWQVQIRRAGLKALSRSFLSKRDAAVWARQMESQADRRELPTDGRTLRLITLGELVERYRDEVSITKRGVEVERSILGRLLRHSICAKSLEELSSSDFADYRDERLAEIKPTSLRRQLVLIHSLFEVARDEWGIAIPINPIANLRLTVPNDQRDRRLRPGELQRILGAASQTRTPYLSEVILFAIETGMRRAEILSIRWRDVDLDRRVVRVTETKNGHPRSYPSAKLQ